MMTQERRLNPPRSPAMVGSAVVTIIASSIESRSASIRPGRTPRMPALALGAAEVDTEGLPGFEGTGGSGGA
ncbi:hypothetical protein Kpho01_43950 [Kitasatospora phosalacinea]|uniref:Uncharacterized protein n=1 Tax=Kitasatospora phosalacinea TaxID=2065 RepID=A0A9W6UPU8_9ACTN|nr:hypothetical protein Kpho01_43950 [Kitasatospora phosalacinea]